MRFTFSRFAASVFVMICLCAVLLFVPSRGMTQSGATAFISGNVAEVNGEILTEKELMFTLMRLHGVSTINDLIEDQIIVNQAAGMGVSLDANETVQYLTGAYAPEKLSALIGAFGESLLDQTVGTQLLALRVVSTKIDGIVADQKLEVTDDQVRGYYLKSLPLWTTPASVRFSLIETATQAEASAAKQRIHSSEDFATVCREVSTHPATRAFGGDIGGLVPQGYSTGERALLETTAFSLGIGQVSDPIQVEEKWFLVMPTEKTEYKEPTLEEMHDYIHAMLMDELVQPFLDEWMSGLVDKATIDVTYPILREDPPASFTPGAEGSFIAPVIGTVNGRTIPEGALLFHLLRQYGSGVIKDMIEETLFAQEGQNTGVSVTDEQVSQEIGKTYSDKTLQILNAAFGPDTIKGTIKRYLVAFQVMGKKQEEIINQHGIEVTDEQVTQYYLDNLERWVRPEMVRFSVIVTATEVDSQAARLRVAGGESFEDVCRAVSIQEQTRAYGGDIGTPIRRGLFTGQSAIIEDNAFNTAVGAVSQPFNVGDTWYLIKVTDKSEAYEPTLSEKRQEIYGALLQQRIAPFSIEWRSTLWEAASIRVVYPIYSDKPSPDFSGGTGILPGQ